MNNQVLQSEAFQKLRANKELVHQASNDAKKYVQQLLEPLVKNDDDLEWLRSSFIASSYEHICFRYRNNVYSVMIDLRDGDKSILPASEFNAQIYDSRIHHFIPCLIPLDKDTRHPIYPDSILIDTKTLQPISIEGGEKTELAAWELSYFAYKLVKEYIIKNGDKIVGSSFIGVPQILFLDKEDNKSYVIIKPHLKGENNNVSKKKVMPKFKGYFADVIILADKDTKLWRNDPIPYEFKGLEPIEKKIEDGTMIDLPVKTAPKEPVAERVSKPTKPISKPIVKKESLLEIIQKKIGELRNNLHERIHKKETMRLSAMITIWRRGIELNDYENIINGLNLQKNNTIQIEGNLDLKIGKQGDQYASSCKFYVTNNNGVDDYNIFNYLLFEPSIYGAMAAYLIHSSWHIMPLGWHANYASRTYIINDNELKYLPRDLSGKGYKITPEVVWKPDGAYVTCSFWNGWKGLVRETVKITFDGHRVKEIEEIKNDVLYAFDCGIIF